MPRSSQTHYENTSSDYCDSTFSSSQNKRREANGVVHIPLANGTTTVAHFLEPRHVVLWMKKEFDKFSSSSSSNDDADSPGDADSLDEPTRYLCGDWDVVTVALRCSSRYDLDALSKAKRGLLSSEENNSVMSDPVIEASREIDVGISGQTLEPVFMRKQQLLSTSTSGKSFSTEPSGEVDFADIIWYDGLTHARQLGQYEKLVRNRSPVMVSLKTLRKRQALALKGLPADKLEVLRRHPTKSLDNLYITGQSDPIDVAWKLLYPPLALLAIPDAFIDDIQAFLQSRPYDPMPLNIAIAAAIIFFDIEKSVDGQMEGRQCTPSGRVLAQSVPKVPLAVFIIYFPHLVRFTEVMSLSRYIHPCRWAHLDHARDVQRSPKLKVSLNHLDEVRMRALYGFITSKKPLKVVNSRIHVLPHTWPGSKLTWPDEAMGAPPPTQELWAHMLLDDVNILGLPAYGLTNEWKGEVALPRQVLDMRCCGLHSIQAMARQPANSFWEHDPKAIRALTAMARTITAVWKNATSSAASASLGMMGSEPFTLLSHLESYPTQQLIGEEPLRQLIMRNRARLSIAAAEKVEINDLSIGEDGFITWDGLDTDILTPVRLQKRSRLSNDDTGGNSKQRRFEDSKLGFNKRNLRCSLTADDLFQALEVLEGESCERGHWESIREILVVNNEGTGGDLPTTDEFLALLKDVEVIVVPAFNHITKVCEAWQSSTPNEEEVVQEREQILIMILQLIDRLGSTPPVMAGNFNSETYWFRTGRQVIASTAPAIYGALMNMVTNLGETDPWCLC